MCVWRYNLSYAKYKGMLAFFQFWFFKSQFDFYQYGQLPVGYVWSFVALSSLAWGSNILPHWPQETPISEGYL